MVPNYPHKEWSLSKELELNFEQHWVWPQNTNQTKNSSSSLYLNHLYLIHLRFTLLSHNSTNMLSSSDIQFNKLISKLQESIMHTLYNFSIVIMISLFKLSKVANWLVDTNLSSNFDFGSLLKTSFYLLLNVCIVTEPSFQSIDPWYKFKASYMDCMFKLNIPA